MKSLATDLVTDVDGSCGGSVSPPFVCVSILPHDISKIDAARIIKLAVMPRRTSNAGDTWY